MNTRHEDAYQAQQLRRWHDSHRGIRWLRLMVYGACAVLAAMLIADAVEAAGTVTQTKYVQLTRGGTPLTTLTTPALPNKDCPVVLVTAAECNDCMAKMIESEKVNRTSGHITYRCHDVSQSFVKFTKPVAVANRAPTISGTPASTATVGQIYSFTPTASDLDGDKLMFIVDNRPPWATFDTATGKLSGTPATSDIGVRSEIRIRVQDGKGGEATLAFGKLTTVAAALGSVTLSWTPPTQNTDGTPLTDLAGYRILYGTAPAAFSQTISVPGNVSAYVVDNLAPATWHFAVRAYNTAGIESANSSIASKSLP